jgi:hypothetical protein
MTFVDPGAIVERHARTQEDAAARRRARPGGTTFIV